ncbi:MAG TPA: translation elongation factor Ts [candidate division Zixibacteria bacterium]|nr:translation elongation factor Ts [candidate division Zixibacteria bacterium]
MEITAQLVKELREKTGAGMMDCKKALAETGGDTEKAIHYLREKGIAKAAGKAGRSTKEGIITSYIHAGSKLGVLVEINCETDFVARTEDFQAFAKDIAMQIAASNPLTVSRDELDQKRIEEEKEIYRQQALNEGKPEKIIDKIVDGKLDKYYSEVCLMDQPFVKDGDKTITDVVNETIARLGENIGIKRFTRFQLGE